AKLKAFESLSTNLQPSESATQWLAFVDGFAEAAAVLREPGPARFRAGRTLQFDEVMRVLPPPKVWAELEKAVEARSAASDKAGKKRELGLRLVAHTLTQNTSKRAEDLKTLDTLAKSGSGPDSGYELNSILESLNQAILATMDDPEAILRLLESQL